MVKFLHNVESQGCSRLYGPIPMSELALLKMSQFVGPSENVPVCCHFH